MRAGVTAVCGFLLSGAMTSERAEAATGDVTQFYVGGIPADITAGADGNLWFTDYIANQIVKMTPAGFVTRYPIPTVFSLPSSITTGPDGSVWFAEVNGNKIGRITPTGVITEFAAPAGVAGLYGGITAGSDGNVWFTAGTGQLGKVTPAGVVTAFPGIGGYEIATGPDGNLWTVNPFNTAIGRITTSGTATYFLPPLSGGTGGAITAGPDGNVWFTYVLSGQGHVGTMTPSGAFVAGFPFPTPNTSSLAIAAGPDGNVWFGEWDYGKIARVTPSGAITEYGVGGARISGVTTGPDGNVWFSSRDGWVGNIEVEPDDVPPALAVPDEIVADATGPNGAIVTFVVTAIDDTDPNPTLVCDPPSGSTFSIGATTVGCTATDASGNQATASFEVQVRGAAEQLLELYDAVVGVGPGTSLADKVREVQASLAAGRLTDARAKLASFIREVTAQSGKTIPAADATRLIEDAARISNVIGD